MERRKRKKRRKSRGRKTTGGKGRVKGGRKIKTEGRR